jgi:SAM-dependent methyltransferase
MNDRKTHWEDVYRSKSPSQVSWFQGEPELSLQLIGKTGVGLDAAIIDVGGGASTLVDGLYERGYSNLSVLDVSKHALEHARNRMGEKAGELAWFEEDITCFRPTGQFSVWHDRAVFHFLTERADRQSYVSVLRKALKPGGHLIIMAFAIDGPVKCSGLDIVQYDAQKMQTELGKGFELLETGYETHLTPAGNQQKFAYFHFVFSDQSPR